MSRAETARRRVVQRRIGSAEMSLPLKSGHIGIKETQLKTIF